MPAPPCATDDDCSLNGVCRAGACDCLAGWSGPECAVLNVQPATKGAGLHAPGGGTDAVSSWGGKPPRLCGCTPPPAPSPRTPVTTAACPQHCLHRAQITVGKLFRLTAPGAPRAGQRPPPVDHSALGIAGSVAFDPVTQKWQMFAAEMIKSCGIGAWEQNSRIVRASSDTADGVSGLCYAASLRHRFGALSCSVSPCRPMRAVR